MAAVFVLAGCGGSTSRVETGEAEPLADSASPGSEDGPDPTRVGCPFGPFFPLESLDSTPPLIEDSPVPEVATAIAPFLEGEEGDFWPREGWRVLEVVANERVELVNTGTPERPELAFMSANWNGEAWMWSGSSIPGECDLVLDPAAIDGNLVDWELDPTGAQLTPESTSVTLIATERDCVSGQAMGDRLNPPVVTVTDDAVLILLTAAPPPGESQDCQGNPSQTVNVDLPEPLGERRVRDARSTNLGDLGTILNDLIANDG